MPIDNHSFNTMLTPEQEQDVLLARHLRDCIELPEGVPPESVVVENINLFAALEKCGVKADYVICEVSVCPKGGMFNYSSELNFIQVHGQLVSFTEARDKEEATLIVMNSLMENIQKQVEIEKQQGKKITQPDFTLENLPWEVEFIYVSKSEDLDYFDTFHDANEVARLHALSLDYKTPKSSALHPRRSL